MQMSGRVRLSSTSQLKVTQPSAFSRVISRHFMHPLPISSKQNVQRGALREPLVDKSLLETVCDSRARLTSMQNRQLHEWSPSGRPRAPNWCNNIFFNNTI